MSRKEPLPPRGEKVAERRERAEAIMQELGRAYPDASCALHYESPWQLLVATMLSAQCTDARVNAVTPALFAEYPDAMSTAGAPVERVEALVRPTGFFRQKARNVVTTAQAVVDRHDGEVPDTIGELVALAGVARKTANVVVSNVFPENIDGIAVDTHVQRVSRRLGLTRSHSPVDIERDLQRLIDRRHWADVTHLLIDHGRAVCKAPTPHCDACPIRALCPSWPRFT